MKKQLKELRVGVRLNIKKPPKIETPKNVYSRKCKHKKGQDYTNSDLFFMPIFSSAGAV